MSNNEASSPQIEWAFVTYDLGAICAECHEAVRPVQAIGHIGDQIIHAKCFKDEERQAV